MAKLQTKTISRRTVEALKVEKDTVFWDSELLGFGVRVYPSGSKYYVVQTRCPFRKPRPSGFGVAKESYHDHQRWGYGFKLHGSGSVIFSSRNGDLRQRT